MHKKIPVVALAAALLTVAAHAADPEYYAAPQSKLPFSEAVRAGDYLLVSGQIGLGKESDPTAAFRSAAHQAMDSIQKILTDHGSSLDHVVQCTVMLADMKIRCPCLSSSRPTPCLAMTGMSGSTKP